MQRPKITIVTPNFNQAGFLEETILSVIGQNYPDLEYIIVDGGSTDGSIDIIKKYEKQLAYWVTEPDKGLYHALQKGFERSTGEVMGWINSDDKLHPGSLSVIGWSRRRMPWAYAFRSRSRLRGTLERRMITRRIFKTRTRA